MALSFAKDLGKQLKDIRASAHIDNTHDESLCQEDWMELGDVLPGTHILLHDALLKVIKAPFTVSDIISDQKENEYNFIGGFFLRLASTTRWIHRGTAIFDAPLA